MTWTRLPDNFTDKPEVLRLERSARLLHVEGLVYCNRLETDGLLSDRTLRRISDSDDLDRDVQQLVTSGLWTRCQDNDGWQLDWSDQELAAKVEKRRMDRNKRQARYNERQRRHAEKDHSMCDPRFCPALRNASRNAPDDAYPTRPVPTGREGQGQGAAAASATASAARPRRTSDGWLATIDANVLAALPLSRDTTCPHKMEGWAWTKDDTLACERCDRAARFEPGNEHYQPKWLSAEQLANERPGTRPYVGSAPVEVWQALHATDPSGVTIALDLASVLFQRFGPITEDPENVNALADDIYRRSINPRAHGDAWAKHQHQTTKETS